MFWIYIISIKENNRTLFNMMRIFGLNMRRFNLCQILPFTLFTLADYNIKPNASSKIVTLHVPRLKKLERK